MHPVRIILAVFAAASLARTASAQAVFSNTITAANPSASNPFTAGQITDLNLTATGIGRGTGINAASATDRFSATGWNSASLEPTDYFTWTLTPTSGYQLNLTSLVYTGQASGSGPTSFAFRSSLDAFSADIGAPTAAGATVAMTTSIFQGLTTPVEFRLYAWNASSAGGTFSVNDFTFNGSLSAIPEPSTYAMMAGLATLVTTVIWKRRRTVKTSL